MAASEPARAQPLRAPSAVSDRSTTSWRSCTRRSSAGQVEQGERLPNERELSQVFAVSRPTVREALRSLEAMGMVEVRPGKSGESFAVAPPSSLVGNAVRLSSTCRERHCATWPSSGRRSSRRTPGGPPSAPAMTTSPSSGRWSKRPRPNWLRATAGNRSVRSTLAGTRPSRRRPRTTCASASPRASTTLSSTKRARFGRPPRTGAAIPRDLARITKAVAARDPEKARESCAHTSSDSTSATRRSATPEPSIILRSGAGREEALWPREKGDLGVTSRGPSRSFKRDLGQ